MNAPEFSRMFSVKTIGSIAQTVSITATDEECAALAKRFDLIAVDMLNTCATLVLVDQGIEARGTLRASVTQRCVATDAPIAAKLREDFSIRFIAALADQNGADEIEINADECDIIEHDGQDIDLGEAVAQSLLLALDPFPRASGAADALKNAGVTSEDDLVTGAFAGLKSLLNPETKS
jgi:uncharacterized metal-binding protein YceD (DUF177 family)